MNQINWSGRLVVYRYYSSDRTLLYVGCTGNMPRRHKQHAANSPWFAETSKLRIELAPNLSAARAREEQAIRLECPKHNIRHNQPRSERNVQVDGNSLVLARARRGLSRRNFADLVNLSESFLAEVEEADRHVPESIVSVWALLLRTNVAALLPRPAQWVTA